MGDAPNAIVPHALSLWLDDSRNQIAMELIAGGVLNEGGVLD
jgi:hypothetical protein